MGYPDPSVSDNRVLPLPWHGDENVISQEIPTHVDEDGEERQNQDNGVLEQNAQLSNDSPLAMSATELNCRNLKLTRSWSCREYYMTGSSERAGEIERTPANGFEKCFRGRPDGLQRKFLPLTFGVSTKLSTNGSPSSIGSPSVDDLRTNSTRTFANDEDITSLQTFVDGMKEMVKFEYEKQLVDDDQVQMKKSKSFLIS